MAQNGQGQVNDKVESGSGPGSESGTGTGTAPGYVPVPTELGTEDNKPVHQLEANPAWAELGGERVYEMGS